MRNSAVIFFLILFSLTAFAQKPKTSKKTVASAKTNLVKPGEKIGSEKEEFDKAVAVINAEERVKALQKFLKNFPAASDKLAAQELIVSARAAAADEKLRLSENENGTRLFRLAVKEAPTPVSDKLFSEVLLQFPTNLFFRGERQAALEIARLIEAKAEGNAKQMLGLATFYIGVENAAEAERLANKALAINPNLPAAYQTLALAHRVNFQLEESAAAYAKALELDSESIVSRRSLAEMKRAVGKPLEAAALYREILAKDATDGAAQTGLILALFDAGERAEAETEMMRAFVVNANNLPLLVGAGYWYAANGDGAKAVELAAKAVAIEPRYTWAHIALARGFLQQKRPLEAERTLLAARQYGNFPTLDYEIAAARLMAGFYREAAEILAPNFAVKGDAVQTRLGGRVAKEADDFIELLALERRASIFQPQTADDAKTAEELKRLLDFNQKLTAAQTDEAALTEAVDLFVGGDDKMRLHRQIYAANRLLQNKKALPKVLELTQAALGKADASLDVPSASAAVLAEELYESRALAAARNQNLLVPEIPRQTLSAVLRGRIEEIAGWTLFEQNKTSESIVRLKRAVSVLPENSAWWRSSMWRLGAALQADGKDKEALESYYKAYPKDGGDAGKYLVVASLYQKINGSTGGLEAQIGARPEGIIFTAPESKPTETTAQNAAATEENTVASTTATNQSAEIQAKTASAENTVEIAKPSVPAEITSQTKPQTVTDNTEATPQTSVLRDLPAENANTGKEKNAEPQTNVDSTVNTPAAEKQSDEARDASKNSAGSTTNSPANEIKAVEPKTPENAAPASIAETKPQPSKDTETTNQQNEQPQSKLMIENNTDSAKTTFEPVVINVPRRELLRNPPSRTSKDKISATTDEQPAASSSNSAPEKSTSSADGSYVRPRVVVTEHLPAAAEHTETIAPCIVQVGQENISLLNNGGSLGILVGYKGKGDLKQLRAVSNSPNDIEIIFDPEIGEINNRAFFIVKSISANKGIYTASFEAPCGKKDIIVRVR